MIYLLYPRASLYTRSEAPILRFKKGESHSYKTIHERPFPVSIARIADGLMFKLLRHHPSPLLSLVLIGNPRFEVVRDIADEEDTIKPQRDI